MEEDLSVAMGALHTRSKSPKMEFDSDEEDSHKRRNPFGVVLKKVSPSKTFRPNCWPASEAPPKADQNTLRFVCISDTHGVLDKMTAVVPEGDVLIHAGDFTMIGQEKEVRKFNEDLKLFPHKWKIVIAGNHELSFDPATKNRRRVKSVSRDPRELLTNCTYLEDAYVVIGGIKIYGSPWQPRFHDWAFNVTRGEPILEKWNLIPDDTDVLITHGPPLGHSDLTKGGLNAGCEDLLRTIRKRVKPKYHIFGHIHEDYGYTSDGQTTFINASSCDLHYRPVNEPVIFDMSISDMSLNELENESDDDPVIFAMNI